MNHFFKGADLATSQYVKIMTSLQNEVDFPLWVGIPQCPMNACSIGLANGITRISEEMVSQGMIATKSFYGGHSLGIPIVKFALKHNYLVVHLSRGCYDAYIC